MPKILTEKQLAWLREHIPEFAESERAWRNSREPTKYQTEEAKRKAAND